MKKFRRLCKLCKLSKLTALILCSALALQLAAVPAVADEAEEAFGGISMLAAVTASGSCGANLTWKLTDDGTLTISGTGPMYDYSYGTPPYFTDDRIKIKQAVFSQGVTSIGNAALFGFSGLEKVTISDSVTSIGNEAFRACNYLTEVTIPESVTSIGRLAFDTCWKLERVTIPSKVTSIDATVFNNCKVLLAIGVSSENPALCSVDGVLFTKDLTKLICYPQGKEGTSYTVPNTVTSIGDSAFANSKLTEITIPDSVVRLAAVHSQAARA